MQVILYSWLFRSFRECKEGRQATTLCWDPDRQGEFRPTNRYVGNLEAPGWRPGEPQSSRQQDFLLFFLLPAIGGRQYGAGESLLIKWSSTSRQSWWSPILALQRLWGSKQAIKQPTLFFLSPANYSRAGSARESCWANVTRKVPGRALQLGFMDHGCESQVQERICKV